MKSIIRTNAILLLAGFLACESPKQEDDSVKIADKENEEVFNNTDREADAEFIVDAVAASYAQIALAKLALLNSNDSAFQRKLRALEFDHTRILDELHAYAARHLITTPSEESKEAKKELQLLEDSHSEDFNLKLCAVLRDHHQEEMRKFEICMSRTKDGELRNWISLNLPTLNDHLKVLKEYPTKS